MIVTPSLDDAFRTVVGNGTFPIEPDAAREGWAGLLGRTLRRAVSLLEDPGLEVAP